MRVYQFRHDRTLLTRGRETRRIAKVAVNIKLSGKLQGRIGRPPQCPEIVMCGGRWLVWRIGCQLRSFEALSKLTSNHNATLSL